MTRGWVPPLLVLAVSLGCGSASESPVAPEPPGPAPPPSPGTVLASGTLQLPAATLVGTSGDHEAFALTHRLPADVVASAGELLVITLRDLTRPFQTCSSDEPEDGCATVDWSDDPTKPNVPRSGRFENRITLELVTGVRDHFLSASGGLLPTPEVIDPNRRHTAIPGPGTRWETPLAADLVPGSDLRIRLWLTKWLDPNVEIGYQVAVL